MEKEIADLIIEELKKRGWKVTTAESCTGGMIASALVGIPGASAVFDEGYITYSNEAKHRLLGVEEEKLQAYGAVSEIVARQMAEGAAGAAGAQTALSATGIAGPDGGTGEKPVGLVYIGCFVNGKVVVTENRFDGDRQQVREQTVRRALALLWKNLKEE